jgi:hypothetical protein
MLPKNVQHTNSHLIFVYFIYTDILGIITSVENVVHQRIRNKEKVVPMREILIKNLRYDVLTKKYIYCMRQRKKKEKRKNIENTPYIHKKKSNMAYSTGLAPTDPIILQ